MAARECVLPRGVCGRLGGRLTQQAAQEHGKPGGRSLPTCGGSPGERAKRAAGLTPGGRPRARIPPALLTATKKFRAPELPEAPLIAFINSRSGGRAGPKLAVILYRTLGHAQARCAHPCR